MWIETITWHGDPRGRHTYADRAIVYAVFREGTVWKYRIDKGGDGTIQLDIPSFPWEAQ